MPEYPDFIGVNSTGKNTWILGFLHSVFNYWTQFYKSTRNHAYMPWELWFNSTRKITWFLGILASSLSLQSTRKHTRMPGYSKMILILHRKSSGSAEFLLFCPLFLESILQFYKKSHIHARILWNRFYRKNHLDLRNFGFLSIRNPDSTILQEFTHIWSIT